MARLLFAPRVDGIEALPLAFWHVIDQYREGRRCVDMTTVQETIPAGLRPEVEAALAWFNRQQDVPFAVTGILDPEAALAASGPRELRLVLCGGDRCEQRSFRVSAESGGYQVTFLEHAEEASARATRSAELDPPPGALRGWLDRALSQHRFVVLVFYRGFW
jgi:hypothetical protein